MAFFKTPRVRDDKHLRYVASLPCMLCRGQAEAHHLLRAEPRGIGLKTGDNWTVPLCRNHHRQLHDIGDEELFFSQYGWQYEQVKNYATMLFSGQKQLQAGNIRGLPDNPYLPHI